MLTKHKSSNQMKYFCCASEKDENQTSKSKKAKKKRQIFEANKPVKSTMAKVNKFHLFLLF